MVRHSVTFDVMNTSPLPRLLKVPEAAEALGVSRHTIYRLIAAGELSSVCVGNRNATRIEESALTAYVERKRRKAIA